MKHDTSTPSSVTQPNDEPIDRRDTLIIASLEGDLSKSEQADFDLQMRHDPEFARAYEDFASIILAGRVQPIEAAPPDFVRQVQGRIRARSNGRFFAPRPARRSHYTSYEAIAALMIAVMAAAWMVTGAPSDHGLRHVTSQMAPQLTTHAGDNMRY